MGKADRAEKRRQERMQKDWNKPYTTNKMAHYELATQEANKLYDEKVEELTQEISNKMMHGVVKTVGLLMASALETEYGFGVKRCAKAISNLMNSVSHLSDATMKVNIFDHEKYWNDKGLFIEEEGGNTVVRVGKKESGK